jgi:hypothetical protein
LVGADNDVLECQLMSPVVGTGAQPVSSGGGGTSAAGGTAAGGVFATGGQFGSGGALGGGGSDAVGGLGGTGGSDPSGGLGGTGLGAHSAQVALMEYSTPFRTSRVPE